MFIVSLFMIHELWNRCPSKIRYNTMEYYQPWRRTRVCHLQVNRWKYRAWYYLKEVRLRKTDIQISYLYSHKRNLDTFLKDIKVEWGLYKGGNQWEVKGDEGNKRVNVIKILCVHLWKYHNEAYWFVQYKLILK
jgi:hypothetical protein